MWRALTTHFIAPPKLEPLSSVPSDTATGISLLLHSASPVCPEMGEMATGGAGAIIMALLRSRHAEGGQHRELLSDCRQPKRENNEFSISAGGARAYQPLSMRPIDSSHASYRLAASRVAGRRERRLPKSKTRYFLFWAVYNR